MKLYIWLDAGAVVVASSLYEAYLMLGRDQLLFGPPDRTFKLDTATDEFDVDPADVYRPEVVWVAIPPPPLPPYGTIDQRT